MLSAAPYQIGAHGKKRRADRLFVADVPTRTLARLAVLGEAANDPTVTLVLGRAAALNLCRRLALAFGFEPAEADVDAGLGSR